MLCGLNNSQYWHVCCVRCVLRIDRFVHKNYTRVPMYNIFMHMRE